MLNLQASKEKLQDYAGKCLDMEKRQDDQSAAMDMLQASIDIKCLFENKCICCIK